MRYVLMAAMVAALTAAANAMADAAEPRGDVATVRDLPPLTPKNRPRIMTVHDETSTSKCIGRMITPLCAVETKIACFLREDQHLCDMVKVHLTVAPGNPSPWSIRYRVTKATILDDRHFPWPPSTDMGQPAGVQSVRAGDIRIDIREMICLGIAVSTCPASYDVAEVYVVRREPGWWRIMGWMPIDDLFR